MSDPDSDTFEDGVSMPSIYETDPTPEEELWFVPGRSDTGSDTDVPWFTSQREAVVDFKAWRKAEAQEYRALTDAAEALARFGTRLAFLPPDVTERVALKTVSAVLRGEGVWIAPEEIALFRAMRASSEDNTRDLERATWAVRRLIVGRSDRVLTGSMHEFLGRSRLKNPEPLPGEDRVTGDSLTAHAEAWQQDLAGLADLHPISRACFALSRWQALELTPYDDALEPMVAASLIGAGAHMPFVPIPEGRRFMLGQTPAEKLRAYYKLVEAGALAALLEIERLVTWREKAQEITRDLSGRTPPSLIDTALRFPVFSADLAAQAASCSTMSARRNLNLLQTRGLVREVTGQQRYRFWSAQI